MKARLAGLFVLMAVSAGCAQSEAAKGPSDSEKLARARADGSQLDTATFAAGCFWCVEEAFDKVAGVISTTSGYTGGHAVNPTYEEVSAGGTGHTEAVRVAFDPSGVGYRELLEAFWKNVDPLDAGGQFCDRGSQYRSGIFVHDQEQRRLAERSKQQLASSGRFDRPIATEIVAATEFYRAEEYHQDYYRKNPLRYRFYTSGCGRYDRLDELWGEAGR
ncbi:MAG: peptide-methionine (S)-S-oxide reductase MsrA [Longimicrobiaceae bacterium]